jgi:isopenicillin-N epimerase
MTDRRAFLARSAHWVGGAGALSALEALSRIEAPGRRLEALLEASTASPTPSWRDESGLPTRDAYLLDPGIHYLNHGSIGTIPRAVHEAHVELLRTCESNPWLYMWDEPWREPVETTRRRAAALMGCDPESVALTHNTTEGFNLLAQGLPLGPGDEVLFSTLNHPGASIPFDVHGARRGYAVRRFEWPLEDVPSLSEADVVALTLAAIRPETRLLVLPHIDNTVGLRHPIETLAARAKALGVRWVAVDGAQALGMLPVHLGRSGVDFYAASPHKWIQAPKGVGLLYVAPGEVDTVAPLWVSSGRAGAAPSIRRFEDYGTRNLPEIVTLGHALAFQETIPTVEREARHRALWAETLDRVDGSGGTFRLRSPRRWEVASAITLVETVGVPSQTVFQRLWPEDGVVFRPFRTASGLDGSRLSPNVQTESLTLAAFFDGARRLTRGG